ncbi:MAG: DUF4386 family protein [Chloroflexota bacterium]
MTKQPLPSKLLGFLLIITPLLTGALFLTLSTIFDTDVPTDALLTYFHANQSTISSLFYISALVNIIHIVIVIGLHGLLAPKHAYVVICTVFGILYNLLFSIQNIQWRFLVTHLAEVFVDPTSSPQLKETMIGIFDSSYAYLGFGIEGNLGLLLLFLWLLGIAIAVLRDTHFPKWLGVLGCISTIMFLVNYLEFLGPQPPSIAIIGTIGNNLINIWQLLLGVFILRQKW